MAAAAKNQLRYINGSIRKKGQRQVEGRAYNACRRLREPFPPDPLPAPILTTRRKSRQPRLMRPHLRPKRPRHLHWIDARMTVLVTGSSGHLGEALMRTLRASGRAALGLDIIPAPFTDAIGSIADRDLVARSMRGVEAMLHPATLHKPHVATHAREAFVETNVRGTLTLLEEAAGALVRAFVMTSTESTFGDGLAALEGHQAA